VSPSTSRPGGRFLRNLAIFAIVVAGLALYGGSRFGAFLYDEDPLQPADAIYVLAGSNVERQLEGAELYLEGVAPVLLLSDQYQEPAVSVLAERGIDYPTDVELALQFYRELGVPADAVLVTRPHGNTADEAVTLHQDAERYGWQRVIVVTSKYHLRRAGFAFRRELAGTGIEVIMRGSRYDPSDPEHWWRTRADWRWMLSEGPKFIAYIAGLGA